MIRRKPTVWIALVLTLALLFGPAVPMAQADTLFNLSAPTSLTADAALTTVTLEWNDTSSWESGFNIERRDPGDAAFHQVGVVANNVETWTNTGLTAGTTYSYRVVAFNDWDATPSWSNTVTVETNSVHIIGPIFTLTAPAAPSGLTADPKFVTVNLEWMDNSNNESSFVIERKDPGDAAFHQIATVGSNVTEYTDEGLTADTEYSYRVKAHNSFGDSAYSNALTTATLKIAIIWPILTAPAAPSNLSADSVSSDEVVLQWSDNSNNEGGFRIERSVGGSPYAEATSVGTDAETWTDTGVEPATTYTYRVRAFNSFGNSVWTNILAVSTPQEGPPPGGTPATTLVYTIGSPNYTWNGVSQGMDVAPVIRESRTLLPIRYVADPLGAQTMWNSMERKVTIMTATRTIELWVDNNTARINGVAVLIDPGNPNVMPVIIPPGRTMMPLSFIASNLDCDVNWNPVDYTVTVTYPQS